ncbi:MAG TPA: OsmC family protein [Gemmatimonadaceae bacterium]|nr:OsmC family protein [Gemmatimonadaceae bacterium]
MPVTTQKPATITVTWDGEQRFDAARPDRPSIKLDGSGGAGPSPVDGLLASLAACAGIDVVEILNKRRTPPESITVEVVGERVTTIPKRLKHVTLNFHITGTGIDRANAERAVDLAINKYCSVRSSLRDDVPVEWTLELTSS